MKIEQFHIGRESAPFTIAEAGINHNGELARALAMVKAAKNAGASAIKFQTFTAKEFIADRNLLFSYSSQGKQITESMLELFERHEFTREEWATIKAACMREGILFLSTPQNPSDLRLLLEIGIPAIKIGSDDFTNLPLIKEYKTTNLPLFISCGMANFEEVKQTLAAIGTSQGYPTVLLLCTSEYPTPPANAHLRKLVTLAEHFPDVVLGFSDHTQGSVAATIAVAYGASVFEKHFTLDRNLPGPDHWFSENPESLREWVKSIHTAHQMLGNGEIRPTEKELSMRNLARRSVVALCAIRKGELLSPVNIGLRRPGDGLSAQNFPAIIGCTAQRDIAPFEKLKKEDFQD